MEVLRDLSFEDLKVLRDAFALRENKGGLTENELLEVLSRLCSGPRVSSLYSGGYVQRLFEILDVVGLGRISWDTLIMYIINCFNDGIDEAVRPQQEVHLSFRPYHLEQLLASPVGTCWAEMRVLHRIGKVATVITGSGGLSTLDICQIKHNIPTCGVIRGDCNPILAWDVVPPRARAPHTNCILCSYVGGDVRSFCIEKKHRKTLFLEEQQYLCLSESQTSVRWIGALDRLALGGRSGLVTFWNLSNQVKISQNRLFCGTVTAIQSCAHLLHAASLDTQNSVKCLDVERNVVQFALDDHCIGGALLLETDEDFLFSSGFERHIVQRPLVAPRPSPTFLYDSVAPHKGRVVALCRLKGGPFLVSGDTHGIVKFWDLRMSSCLQTLNFKKPFLDEYNDEPALAVKGGINRCSHVPVKSICHLDELGKVVVATPKKLLVLTSDVFIHPDLVDDKCRCRFVFFPKPDVLLTVHDQFVKVWNSLTGTVVRRSEPGLIESDITSCCVVEPLKRQLLVGTAKGEVKALSVVLLKLTVDLTPTLRQYIGGREITSLHIVEKFHDTGATHVFVGTQSLLLVVPFSNADCGHTQRVIQFDNLVKGLLWQNLIISALAVTQDQLIIATSCGCVHIVQHKRVVKLSRTFNLFAQVDTVVVKPVHACDTMGSEITSSDNYIVFITDVTGRVYIAALRSNVTPEFMGGLSSGVQDTMPMRNSVCESCEMLGSWISHRPGSWIMSRNGQRHRHGSRSVPAHYWGSSETQRRLKHSTRNDFGDADASSVPFSLEALAMNSVFLVFLESYKILITADEAGVVRMWDVNSAVAWCAGKNVSSSAPVLFSTWQIHKQIIFLAAVDHPKLHLPVLLEATSNQQVSMWSLDGVALGTLASGREVDVASGGRRFGLQPYLLMAESTTAALWKEFVAHVTHAKVHEEQLVSAVDQIGSSFVTHTQSEAKQADKRHWQLHQAPPVSTTRGAGTLMVTPTVSGTPPPPIFPPLAVQSSFTVDKLSGSPSRPARRNDDKHDDDKEDKDKGTRGREAGVNSVHILKPEHRNLLTCIKVPTFSHQSGLGRLPQLSKSTVQRNLR